MTILTKPQYSTIGPRLSMQLLSDNRYGFPGGKFTSAFLYDVESQKENTNSIGFKYELIPAQEVVFFDGPNLALGFSENDENCLNKPHIALIYDDLDFENLSLMNDYYRAYQARVIFEESLEVDDYFLTCSALKHALTLMTLRENLNTLFCGKPTPIILGIHKEIDYQFPMVAATILDAGFKPDNRYLDDQEVKLFHKNTQWNLDI